MGGYGSGRVDGREPKRTVEDGLRLSVRDFVAEASPHCGGTGTGTKTWTRILDEDLAFVVDDDDDGAPSIGWSLDLPARSLTLTYTCQGAAIDMPVRVTRESTPPGRMTVVRKMPLLRPTRGVPSPPVSAASVAASVQAAIALACDEAGVPAFTPHGLRRAAVDTLIRAGVDPGTACAILGHSPAVMLQQYRRATMDDPRKAVVAARLAMMPAGEVVAYSRKVRA